MNIKNIIYNFLLFILLKPKVKKKLNPTPQLPKFIRFFSWGNGKHTSKSIPKIIWTYWSGEKSACANACLSSLARNNKDFDVIKIDETNLFDYLPDFPTLPNTLPIQSVSDVIRLSLLEKYGGIWIDMSVISTDSLYWVLDTAEHQKVEMVCFYNEFNGKYMKNHHRPIIETGFLAAVPGSLFIGDWLKNYKECIFSEDWKNFYRAKKNYSELILNFKKKDHAAISYLSVYIAAQQTMMESNYYKLFLINAEDEYYFYYYKTTPPRNRIKFCEWILVSEEPVVKPKLIKLPKGHREVADKCITLGYFNPSSLMGKYL